MEMQCRLSALTTFMLVVGVLTAAAADKSGVSPNTISLPKGPGSIEGLGEAFQPTLNTGTAKYGIKLTLPPGPAGHAPNLSLNYEGGGGNGCIGLGWALPTAYIQRQTDKGIPRYVDGPNGQDDDSDGTVDEADEPDPFINEAREEIVPVTTGATTAFFCKNESSFVRYRRVGDHWEGDGPDGSLMIFGASPTSRIADPANATHIFRWLIEELRDVRGNSIRFSYRTFPGAENLSQRYLERIEYGAGPAPWGGHFHLATFSYESRPDWFEDCRSGFPMRSGQRLVRVAIATQGVPLPNHQQGDLNADGSPDLLNRRYDLHYREGYPWSLLDRVTSFGADGQTALPATDLGYTLCNSTPTFSASGHLVVSENPPVLGFDSPQVDLIDLNGDGLPDLLRTSAAGGGHSVTVNQGQRTVAGSPVIRWSDPITVATPADDQRAWQIDLADSQNHLADLDGDGLSDLVHVAAGEVAFYRNAPRATGSSPSWNGREPMAYADFPPPSPFGSSDVRTADINFDKRTDIIQSSPGGGIYQTWFNLGDGQYSQRVTTSPATVYEFSTPGVQIADLNGDRVADMAWIRPTQILFTPGLGHGNFGTERSIPLPGGLTLTTEQITRARLQDATGDGLVDFVIERPVPGEIWFWTNVGNDTLGPRRIVTDLPAAIGPTTEVRWADMNGNGSTDLVYSDSANGQPIQYIDLGSLLDCSPHPHLLTDISNGIGRVTRIGYATSTSFALADGTDAAGDYTYSWPSPLPFPVDVVSSILVSDSLGETYLTNYDYHDGYYDPEEKQFRGFARVEQIDAGDATAPTLVTRSHFDVGDTDEALKGRVRRLTKEDAAGSAFSDEIMDYQVKQLYAGLDARTVRFAHALNKKTDLLEQGRGTPRQLYAEYEYDNYGNRTVERNYGVVEGANRTTFDDERFTITSFAINPTKWLLHLPFQEEIQDDTGKVISRRRTFYDDETFSGTNGGTATIGNATLVREWSDIAENKFIAAKRVRYDPYGNPIHLLDPLYGQKPGHWREIAYDPGFHTYPQTETIHTDATATLVVQAAYDFGFGTIVQSLDFNDNPTFYGYDPLARLTSVVRPYDTVAAPTTEYDYRLAQPFGAAGGLINFIETRQREVAGGGQVLSRQFVDGLGRQRLSKQEDAEAGKFVVTQARNFNARREARFVSNPYQTANFDFELPPAPAVWPAVETHYDALLRPLKTIQQDGEFLSNVYEPLVTRLFDEEDNDPASPHTGTPHAQYKDGLGRLTGVDELNAGQTWETRYDYDLLDNLTRITDSQANVKTMVYDSLKRMTGMNDPDRGVMTYLYDDASNLEETIDAKSQHIRMAYDGVNRIKSEDYLDAAAITPDVSYFYDSPQTVPAGDGTTATSANTKGKLTRVTDLSGEEYFSFDARSRTEWKVKRIPDPANGALVSYQCAYQYDSLDRLVSHTFPDGDFVGYGYDARSLPRTVTGGATGFIISDVSYKPSGQMEEISFGNQVATGYGYDSRLRLQDLETNSPVAGTLIKFHYGFDGASNITRIDDNRPVSAIPASDPRRNTQVFAYDDLYRLTQVKYPATAGQIDYGYDRIGNMLSQISNIVHEEKGLSVTQLGDMSYGGTSDSAGAWHRQGRTGPQPGPHALTAVSSGSRSYPYDANGNMETIDGMACTWDFKDRLIAVENAEMRAEYSYDYTDRRITKKVTPKITVSGLSTLNPQLSTSVLYPDRTFEVREYAAPVKYVWNGDTRVARITTNLNATQRVQRFTLHPGWNIVALAVTLTDGTAQFFHSPVQQVYRQGPGLSQYSFIPPNEPLPAGTLLRVYASAPGTLAVRGTWTTPAAATYPAGRQWIVNNRFEPLDVTARLSADAPLWFFDATTQDWRHRFLGPLASTGNHPSKLAPGEATFAATTAPFTLSAPDPALEIRYYHQDHLGSSNVMTDATGQFVSDSTFYPFGYPRQENQPRGVKESYGFTQKEKDGESGLNYFEARYNLSALGRFASVDPALSIEDSTMLVDPQQRGAYSYCRNSPMTRIDPTGCVSWSTVGKGALVSAIGVVAVAAAIPSGGTSLAGGAALATAILGTTAGFTLMAGGAVANDSDAQQLENAVSIGSAVATLPLNLAGAYGAYAVPKLVTLAPHGPTNLDLAGFSLKAAKNGTTILSGGLEATLDMSKQSNRNTVRAVKFADSILGMAAAGASLQKFGALPTSDQQSTANLTSSLGSAKDAIESAAKGGSALMSIESNSAKPTVSPSGN